MSWGVEDVSEQRLRFVLEASRGDDSMAALCRKYEISRPTGYLWLARYRGIERLQELTEQSRKPHQSPNRTGAEIEARVLQLRRERPDWGARKLRVLLQKEGVALPAITIHRIIDRHGLVEERDRRRAAVKRFERASPNELWQMDFKGMPEDRKGCLPLSVLDDHSRYLTGLRAVAGTQAEPVRHSLQSVFEECGVPEALLMDHGTPWWNMQSARGWTWLTVWIMRQGIRVGFSGYRHPQTQGKVERCHGSMEAAMYKRPKRPRQSWQDWLDEFRREYNEVRPHEALAMQVPASRWKRSDRTFRAEPKQWEYPAGADVRKVRENGGISLRGHSYFIGRALIGSYVQLERVGDRVVVLYCATAIREFDLRTGESYGIVWDREARAE